MSLFSAASISQPCSFAIFAKCWLPVQPLLLARHGQENNCRGKLQLAQTRAHSRLTAVPLPIVVGPGASPSRRECRCCANRSARSPARCASRSPRRSLSEPHKTLVIFRGLRNSAGGRLGERIGFHLQASAASLRITLEFRLNPLPRRPNPVAGAGRRRVLRRNSRPRSKNSPASQYSPNAFRRNLLQRSGDPRNPQPWFRLRRLQTVIELAWLCAKAGRLNHVATNHHPRRLYTTILFLGLGNHVRLRQMKCQARRRLNAKL